MKPYIEFTNLQCKIDDWSTDDIRKLQCFKPDRSISYEEDPDWYWGIKVANKTYNVQLEESYLFKK